MAIYFHDLPEREWQPFREIVQFFRDHGYRFVNIKDFTRSAPGEKVIWLSFDDNHAVWWRALSLFDELGINVSFFINSGPIGGAAGADKVNAYYDRIDHHGERTPLSIDQAQDLVRAGHSIGCHSTWHYPLTGLTDTQVSVDIAGNKAMLEAITGYTVKDLAFPYGMRRFFNERLSNICRTLGFERIAYGIPGFQHEQNIEPMMIHRTRWLFENDLSHNLDDLCIDGRLFERLTGRSAIG